MLPAVAADVDTGTVYVLAATRVVPAEGALGDEWRCVGFEPYELDPLVKVSLPPAGDRPVTGDAAEWVARSVLERRKHEQ